MVGEAAAGRGDGATTGADGGMGGATLAIEDDCSVAALVGGATVVGRAAGAAVFIAGFIAGPSRPGRNASASTPANATEDIHEDTRVSVLSTDAIDAMLTCWSITAKKLCVFPCRTFDEERGEIGIAAYLIGMKVRLPAPPGNDSRGVNAWTDSRTIGAACAARRMSTAAKC
jgi:hypothetical protein